MYMVSNLEPTVIMNLLPDSLVTDQIYSTFMMDSSLFLMFVIIISKAIVISYCSYLSLLSFPVTKPALLWSTGYRKDVYHPCCYQATLWRHLQAEVTGIL